MRADNVDLMEPAHSGEREAATDRVVSVAGGLRAEPAPDIEVLFGAAPSGGHSEPADLTKTVGDSAGDMEAAIALGRSLVDNLSRVLLGTPGALTAAAMAALSGGHLLIEDVPGVGKTTLALSVAKSIGCTFQRIQFTSDLLPSDILGAGKVMVCSAR